MATKKTKSVEIVESEVCTPKKTKKKDPTVTQKKKILFVASEARPFIATGGLADVIGSLPQALAKDPKYDIRVILPLYSETMLCILRTSTKRLFLT